MTILGFWLTLHPLIIATVGELPDAQTLIAKSISYHDPDELFLSTAVQLRFSDERPGSEPREAQVVIDVPNQRFEMVRSGEREIAGIVDPNQCLMTLDGRADPTDQEREAFRLSCDRIRMFRDYYTYLWGLPMKLKDKGTQLGEPFTDQFNGQPVVAIRVQYDPGVGSDTWYFYFQPSTHALVGYRFYHDESQNDGEYIVLQNEVQGHGMRLPKSRAWYTHQGDEWLGTDHLLSIQPAR